MKALILIMMLAAHAVSAGGLPEGVARVSVLPGWRDGNTHYAGLLIELAPGWHTYWRVPGEAGIPPLFDWTASGNLASGGVAWPVPELFDQNGMTSIGYLNRVVLPLVLKPGDAAEPIDFYGHVEIGVCNAVCTPFSADVSAELPAGGAPDEQITAALAAQAVSGTRMGVGDVTCAAAPIDDGMRVTSRIALQPFAAREHVVIELPGSSVWVSDATVSRDGGELVAVADMVPPSAQPFALDRSALRITVIGGGKAVEIRGCTGG